MYLSRPVAVVGQVSCLLLLVGRSDKGLFSCDREAAACGLLRVHLVHFAVLFLKGGCVETVRQHGRESCNVLSGFELFNAAPVHFLFNGIFEGFDFGGCFGGEGFPFFEGFDFRNDFDA